MLNHRGHGLCFQETNDYENLIKPYSIEVRRSNCM